LYLASLLLV